MSQECVSQSVLEQLDDAVTEVFELMLDLACIPAPPERCPAPLAGYTASVIFSGALNGACAVHLDHDSAGVLTRQLTGEASEPGSPSSADLVGELCNMIAGSWKSRLAPALATCHLSSPVVQASTFTQSAESTFCRAYDFAPHCLSLELTLA